MARGQRKSRLRVVFRKLVLGSLPLAGLLGQGGCGGTDTKPVSCPPPELILADAGTPPDLVSSCQACRGGTAVCFAADAGYNECRCAPFTGRRPAGLAQATPRRDATALGAYFAEAAFLELASVHAFRQLGAELERHGAPTALVHAARRAGRDEVRHARVTSELALLHGARPDRPVVAQAQRRSLEELALENAVEGCVRETYGALCATWQAEAAEGPAVRAALQAIARDETRHAELAWDLANWAEPQLDGRARANVARARAEALHELWHEAQHEPPDPLVRTAGVPRSRVARALLQGLAAALPA